MIPTERRRLELLDEWQQLARVAQSHDGKGETADRLAPPPNASLKQLLKSIKLLREAYKEAK